jgi:hypothetical protein
MIPEIAMFGNFNGISTQGYHRGGTTKKSVNTDFQFY